MRVVFIENKNDYNKDQAEAKKIPSIYVCYDWMTWDYLNKKNVKSISIEEQCLRPTMDCMIV